MNPSILIDESIGTAGDHITKAIKTAWEEGKLKMQANQEALIWQTLRHDLVGDFIQAIKGAQKLKSIPQDQINPCKCPRISLLME